MLPTAFDRWLEETFTREGSFTIFLVLFEEATNTVVPIASSYLHVIGTDVRFDEIVALIDAGGLPWHCFGVFAAKTVAGGPLPDLEAGRRLLELQQSVLRDRLTLRKGELFDRQGRRLQIDLAGD